MKTSLPSEVNFYNGDKIMSLTDCNNEKPGWRVVTGNRSSGKTTYFNTRMLKRFIKCGEQTAFIYRYKNQLDNVYEKVFKPIEFRFDRAKMRVGRVYSDGFCEIFYGKEVFGYALAMNACETIKTVSNNFNQVQTIIWDEFQSVKGKYLPNEMDNFFNVYDSIARGENEMVRPVPIIAISNLISMLNPLMTELKIFNAVDEKTKFKRGDGYVFEQNINLSAIDLRNSDPVKRAAGRVEQPEAVYLNDSLSNIKRAKGRNRYFLTILADGKQYGIRWYENGLISCTKSIDKSCRFCYTKDMRSVDNVWTINNDIPHLRAKFSHGDFVFQDLECRQAVIDFLKF